jgi:hypothetical protein
VRVARRSSVRHRPCGSIYVLELPPDEFNAVYEEIADRLDCCAAGRERILLSA